MIFNSLTYLLMLAIVVSLYWIFPYRARMYLVFISSLVFYGFWRLEFVPIMLLSVVVDYVVAKRMPGSSASNKKYLLYASLLVNFGLLFYFKYLIFFADNVIGLANILGASIDPLVMNIILPLGISFYTFQTISYTVDVYREKIQPENDFVLYACYITFFPQLVAGPILRAAEVIHQFKIRPEFSGEYITIGIRRIIYGLFLKVVLADNIAPLVDAGYSAPIDLLSALDVWVLAFLFGFQIYFDFSAYSHIAIGSARLMGICFPENFNFPYVSVSPKDFWRRWHISLSSWIRDYLYLPLAGIAVHDRSTGGLANATMNKKKTKALFLTWGIMGLWHGANWTFLLWGLYHAAIIYIYRLFEGRLRNNSDIVKIFLGIMITLPVMMLAWIPFRADSVADTFQMWVMVINPYRYGFLGMRENTYLIASLILFGVHGTYWIKRKILLKISEVSAVYLLAEILVLSVMISLVIVFLRPINQFIYFQF